MSGSLRVKVVKDWKGEICLADDARVTDLCTAITCAAPNLVLSDIASFIVRGKRVDASAQEATPLEALGVTDGTTVMMVRASPAASAARAQELRHQRLQEVERAARMLSAKHPRADDAADGGSTYELSITNQDGREVSMPKDDRRALSLGCLLHAKGKQLLEAGSRVILQAIASLMEVAGTSISSPSTLASLPERAFLDDAMHLFEEAERAMELCEKRWLAISDNYALLLLDMVWSSLLIHTTDGSLSQVTKQREASARIDKARAFLQALHGPDWQRLALREDTGAQRAIYVRLFVLQGAIAFHRGDLDDARSLLTRAEGLRSELILTADDDEKMARLLGMGFDPRAARAALLACSKDVSRAAARILEKRTAAERERRERRLRKEQQRELRSFGKTVGGHSVDLEGLAALQSLGYSKALAAEALRRAENHVDAALTQLTSEEAQQELQVAVLERLDMEACIAERPPPRAADPAGAGLPSGEDAGSGAMSGAISAPAVLPGAATPSWADAEEEQAVEESGLREAISSAERSYEEVALHDEGVALKMYLDAVCAART